LYSKNQQVRQDAAGALVNAIHKYPNQVSLVLGRLLTRRYLNKPQLHEDAVWDLVGAIKKYPDKVTFFFKEKGMDAVARCFNSIDLKKKDSSITALLEALPKRKNRRRQRRKIKADSLPVKIVNSSTKGPRQNGGKI